MKIASIMTSLSRKNGGLFDSVRRLHQSLAELPGMDVSVLGVADEFTNQDLSAWSPVPVHAFQIVGWKKFAYAPDLRRHLFISEPEIVHTQGLWDYPSLVVSAWHRKYRRPYMISPHGMLDPWAVRNSAWKKRLAWAFYEREHLKNAGVIRALCESEGRSIRKFGLKNPICIIPNGIDPAPVGENLALEIESSPFKSFAKDRKVLLYLGRIHPKKGLVNLLRAWKSVHDSPRSTGDSWILAVAGWDQSGHESELRKLSAECGMENSVYFLGPRFGRDKVACYRNCNAFVLPSFSEGLPMVVLEAWAYEKPVLMTPACNLPQGFAAQAALRMEPNLDSLMVGLQQFFNMSHDEQKTMGQRGLALVKEQFAWPKIASDMMSVYRWMLAGGPKPECVAKM